MSQETIPLLPENLIAWDRATLGYRRQRVDRVEQAIQAIDKRIGT